MKLFLQAGTPSSQKPDSDSVARAAPSSLAVSEGAAAAGANTCLEGANGGGPKFQGVADLAACRQNYDAASYNIQGWTVREGMRGVGALHGPLRGLVARIAETVRSDVWITRRRI